MKTETCYQVRLTPIEPLLFSDNRSTRAGEDHLIRDQDPSPQTIYGSIGAYIVSQLGGEIGGLDWEIKIEPFLGPFSQSLQDGSAARSELLVYHYTDFNGEDWFPRPNHFLFTKSEEGIYKTAILPTVKKLPAKLDDKWPATSLNDSFTSYLHYPKIADECDETLYIDRTWLQKTLCWKISPGERLVYNDDGDKQLRLTGDFYSKEIRMGLAMDNKLNTTEKGKLFSRPYRRFRTSVSLDEATWRSVSYTAYFKTLHPITIAEAKTGIAFLGGDRGRAMIDFSQVDRKDLFEDIKKAVIAGSKNSKGFFVYLLTPAVWRGSIPNLHIGKHSYTARAASVGRSHTISGWQVTSGKQTPRPIKRLLPAGTTAFFDWNGTEDRKDIINHLWLEPFDGDQYRNAGYGRLLIGVWR